MATRHSRDSQAADMMCDPIAGERGSPFGDFVVIAKKQSLTSAASRARFWRAGDICALNPHTHSRTPEVSRLGHSEQVFAF